jgi:hypothetical protein
MPAKNPDDVLCHDHAQRIGMSETSVAEAILPQFFQFLSWSPDSAALGLAFLTKRRRVRVLPE